MKKLSLSLRFHVLSSLMLSCVAISVILFNFQATPTQSINVNGHLVIATASDVVTLDPHGSNDMASSQVLAQVYEPLLHMDENLELQPGLAIHYERIDDLTWEFKLRQGVQFHDGTTFDAQAVKQNIERILDPDMASPRVSLFNMMKDIHVVSEYTVRFVTHYPFAPLPTYMSHSGGGMISPQAIKQDRAGRAELSMKPVGTGPFLFENWQAGQEIILAKNKNYWGELAQLDALIFKVVPEDLTRMAMLETGDVHIIQPLSLSVVPRVDKIEGIRVNRTQGLSLSYLGFNTQKEPFTDVRVRQAISMAINKEDIVQGVLDGTGLEAKSPLGPDVFGYNAEQEGLPYDPEQAKQLLAEAGYPEGFSTTIWTNNHRERVYVAEIMQFHLKKIGIEAKIELMEWGAYLDNTAQGKHGMFILGWGTSTADADYPLYFMFHSDNIGSHGNRSFYVNKELDAIIEQARQEFDESARSELYYRAQDILVHDAPVFYAHHPEYMLGISEKVHGFRQHPTSLFMLRDVWVEE